MGLFSVLMQKVFHAGAVAEAPPDAVKPGQNPASGVEVRQAAQAGPSAPAKMSEVDVEAALNGLAAKHHEKLDWKHSIVDLMKLVGMDSSLSARKELAADLHYSGDTNDSAKMNIWLHKQVMKKLADNGGKVPADLLD